MAEYSISKLASLHETKLLQNIIENNEVVAVCGKCGPGVGDMRPRLVVKSGPNFKRPFITCQNGTDHSTFSWLDRLEENKRQKINSVVASAESAQVQFTLFEGTQKLIDV